MGFSVSCCVCVRECENIVETDFYLRWNSFECSKSSHWAWCDVFRVCVHLIPHPHYHFLSRNRCHPAIESWSFVMRECRGFYRSITSIHTHSSNQPTNLHLTLTHCIPIWVVLSVSLHFSPNTEMRRKTKSKHSAMHSDSSKCSKVNIDRIKF